MTTHFLFAAGLALKLFVNRIIVLMETSSFLIPCLDSRSGEIKTQILFCDNIKRHVDSRLDLLIQGDIFKKIEQALISLSVRALADKKICTAFTQQRDISNQQSVADK